MSLNPFSLLDAARESERARIRKILVELQDVAIEFKMEAEEILLKLDDIIEDSKSKPKEVIK